MQNVNIERVWHSNRHELLGIFNMGLTAMKGAIKVLLANNSLHSFRENALKGLEDLETNFLGLPELAKIVCRPHLLLDVTSVNRFTDRHNPPLVQRQIYSKDCRNLLHRRKIQL